MITPEQYEQQRIEHERQAALERKRTEDLDVALGVARNRFGIAREQLLDGLQKEGTRLARFKRGGVQQDPGGYMVRTAGLPDDFALLAPGEQPPAGCEVVEEASLRETISGAMAERAAARRRAGANAMNDLSPEVAKLEMEAIKAEEEASLHALDASLDTVLCQELAHAGLGKDGEKLIRGAFERAREGDDAALDEVLVIRKFVEHPSGRKTPAYLIREWSAEGAAAAEAPLPLEDSADGTYKVRTLRKLAGLAYDKHVALMRYGQRALEGLPGYSGPLF